MYLLFLYKKFHMVIEERLVSLFFFVSFVSRQMHTNQKHSFSSSV